MIGGPATPGQQWLNTLPKYKQGDPPGYYVAEGTFVGVEYPIVAVTENNMLALVTTQAQPDRPVCQLDYYRGEIIYRAPSENYLQVMRAIINKLGLTWLGVSGRLDTNVTKGMVTGRLVKV